MMSICSAKIIAVMFVSKNLDRNKELSILSKAIDELRKVKITEWIRGGHMAWMEDITKHDMSAYVKSPPGSLKDGGEDSSVSVLQHGIHISDYQTCIMDCSGNIRKPSIN